MYVQVSIIRIRMGTGVRLTRVQKVGDDVKCGRKNRKDVRSEPCHVRVGVEGEGGG